MNEYDYEFKFIISLIITIITETLTILFLYYIFRKRLKTPIKIDTILISGIIPSLATLPYLWFILPLFIRAYLLFIVVGEISVVIIESIILFYLLKIKFLYSVVVSLICNLCSFLLGVVLKNLVKL